MFSFVKKNVSVLFISTLLTSAPAFADIIISGTRIIYFADKKDVNVRLENKGNRPLLIQNWLDTGDDNADPSQIKVPFTSTPPVSRIEPKRGQTVKVMFTGTTQLSADRESVFWFNVLEVPPRKMPNQTKIYYNWLSVPVSNFFIAQVDYKVNPLKHQPN